MAKNHHGKKFPDGLKNLANKESETVLKILFRIREMELSLFIKISIQ